MTEIPEYLVPTDGLTNSLIQFAGLDAIPGQHGAKVRFDIFDEDRSYLATFSVKVGPQPEETIDAVVAEGHRQMRDILRQWLYSIDVMHQVYSRL